MKISQAGVELIKSFEGFSATPYKCIAGVWTIGYGHTTGVTEDSGHITERYASQLLEEELRRYGARLMRMVKVNLSQGEYDALVSFVYNLGLGSFQRSTLRQKLNRGDKAGAANEFAKWCKAGGRPVAGLLRRRYAEGRMFLS
jgi:lysozyme